ncbi:hypothetical protein lbkm_0956 [Lachnospiraceae bacterium KM106-2]|nr:hypothetical protein lbkm_0956 [Lachnospiraceae bacterium KM106-2]
MRKRIKLPYLIVFSVLVLLFVGYSIYTYPMTMQDVLGKELKYVNSVTVVKINTGKVKTKKSGSPISTSGIIKGKKLEELKNLMNKARYRREIRANLLPHRGQISNQYMISLYMYHDNKLIDTFFMTEKGSLSHAKDSDETVYLYSGNHNEIVGKLKKFLKENVNMK